ncbi:MAG: hypothetical protein K2W82_17505 [Candidatus Obscuribacterales bacterium]|nr:hypothetical protein [Candidatus Obscuribacterales bacterium]
MSNENTLSWQEREGGGWYCETVHDGRALYFRITESADPYMVQTLESSQDGVNWSEVKSLRGYSGSVDAEDTASLKSRAEQVLSGI